MDSMLLDVALLGSSVEKTVYIAATGIDAHVTQQTTLDLLSVFKAVILFMFPIYSGQMV